MKKTYPLAKLLLIIVSISSFSCAKKEPSNQLQQNVMQEKISSNKIGTDELESNSLTIDDSNKVNINNGSEQSPISNEDTLTLLQPTESELNNKVINEDQITDVNTQ